MLNGIDPKEVHRLHEQALYNQGARQALLVAQQAGALLFTEKGRYKAYRQVYSDAIYNAILQDVTELEMWLSGSKDGYFYDHERDKRGKLIRCKYTWDALKAEQSGKENKRI